MIGTVEITPQLQTHLPHLREHPGTSYYKAGDVIRFFYENKTPDKKWHHHSSRRERLVFVLNPLYEDKLHGLDLCRLSHEDLVRKVLTLPESEPYHNANEKYSDNDIQQIRELFATGTSVQDLIKQFGMSPRQLMRIINGEARNDVGYVVDNPYTFYHSGSGVKYMASLTDSYRTYLARSIINPIVMRYEFTI